MGRRETYDNSVQSYELDSVRVGRPDISDESDPSAVRMNELLVVAVYLRKAVSSARENVYLHFSHISVQ